MKLSLTRLLLLPLFLLAMGEFHFLVAQNLEEKPNNSRLPRENLLLFREKTGETKKVKSVEDWLKRREEVVKGMESVMGKLPGMEKRTPLKMKVLEETDCVTHVRKLIQYESEPGSFVPAYLLIPKTATAKSKAPAVLCLHGTNNVIGHGTIVGLGDNPNRGYAMELAQKGFVTLAPNYPLLAKYQPNLKELGWESGTLKAVWDNIRGLDLLETLPMVDNRQGFATIGHSLGGHNSVYTAVFEPRLRCIVTSCGLDSYVDYFQGDEKNWFPEKGWCQTRYMLKLANYRGRLAEIPFDFHEMVGALAPRKVLILAPIKDSNFRTESVDQVVKAAQPVFRLYGQGKNLQVEHPDCAHDFPPEMRELAYQTIESVLRKKN